MATIFTVDDEEAMIKVYRDMVELKGHRVVAEAFNGEEAVTKFKMMKPRPDVIIMDHRMPNKNGIEAMKEIRSINPLQGMIFVTADLDAAKKALDMGANCYILKPFRFDDLYNSIETTLSKINEKRSQLKQVFLTIVTNIINKGDVEIEEVCDSIDHTVISDFPPGANDGETPAITAVALACTFFNMMDMEYTYDIMDDGTIQLKNKRCLWKDTMGSNPAFCFTTKCIISSFLRRTGLRFDIRTMSTIMNLDDDCSFRIIPA